MKIRKTDDGSSTIWSDQYQETYHSTFGAVTESNHVFIEAGFKQVKINPVYIFEMGFGTGLNALLTFKAAQINHLNIVYHAIERHPVSGNLIEKFAVEPELEQTFNKIHEIEWNKEVAISSIFTLKKIQNDLTIWNPENLYHLVYFDAFSPEIQPELWAQEIFEKIYQMLFPEGIITTYCAKGIVRRNMIAAGFKVERLPGPPGKREMLRAVK